jgi:hypothetical protein
MKTAFIITIFAVLAIVFFPVTFVMMAISFGKSYTKKELEKMGIDYDYH